MKIKATEVLLYGGLAAGAYWLWKNAQAQPSAVEQSNALSMSIAARQATAQGVWNQALSAIMTGDNEFFSTKEVAAADQAARRTLTAKEIALLTTGEGRLDASGRVVLLKDSVTSYEKCRAALDPNMVFVTDPCGQYAVK